MLFSFLLEDAFSALKTPTLLKQNSPTIEVFFVIGPAVIITHTVEQRMRVSPKLTEGLQRDPLLIRGAAVRTALQRQPPIECPKLATLLGVFCTFSTKKTWSWGFEPTTFKFVSRAHSSESLRVSPGKPCVILRLEQKSWTSSVDIVAVLLVTAGPTTKLFARW